MKCWLFTSLNIAFLGWGVNGVNLVNICNRMIYFSGLVYSPSVIAVHICTYKLYSDSVGCCAGGTSFVSFFKLFFIYPFLWFPLVSFCPPPSGWLSGLYLCTCCVLVMYVLQNVMCHEWLDEMQKAGIWIHTLPSIPPFLNYYNSLKKYLTSDC